jgi:hypothetical protein
MVGQHAREGKRVLGRLAQLVARLHGMQKVTGSNPVLSTGVYVVPMQVLELASQNYGKSHLTNRRAAGRTVVRSCLLRVSSQGHCRSQGAGSCRRVRILLWLLFSPDRIRWELNTEMSHRGLVHHPAKVEYPQGYRGFESHHLRKVQTTDARLLKPGSIRPGLFIQSEES